MKSGSEPERLYQIEVRVSGTLSYEFKASDPEKAEAIARALVRSTPSTNLVIEKILYREVSREKSK